MPQLQEGSLSWAICDALKVVAGNWGAGDISVLINDPQKFFSFVTDGYGATDSAEMQALRIGCLDRGYLPIFHNAARFGVTYLEASASEATAYLQRLLEQNPIPPGMSANTKFRWSQSVAGTVSNAMVEGIEAFMGWGYDEANVPHSDDEITQHVIKSKETKIQDDVLVPVNPVTDHPVHDDPSPDGAKRKAYIIAIIVLSILVVLVIGALVGMALFDAHAGKGTDSDDAVGKTELSEADDANEDADEDDGDADNGQIGREVGETVNEITATLSFDANGAEEGTPPKPMECAKDTDTILPDVGDMRKEGYVFGGWGLSKDAYKVYGEGDAYYVDDDATLYAIWNVVVEESKDFETTEIAYAADDGGYVAMVFVTNNSKQTYDLMATFDFIDAGGKTVESGVDSVWSIGPGDTTLVTKQTSKKSTKNARWRMVASRPAFGASSIAPLLKATVTKTDDNGAELTVTNESEKPCYLTFATLYGRDDKGHFAQQTNAVEQNEQLLEPKASIVLTYEGNYWQYFTNDVYLYGYADKYDQ